MKNFISIPEYSEYLEKTFKFEAAKWDIHMKRVRFGKQLLELWMFVPCKLVNGVWEIMILPGSAPIYTHSKEYELEWRQAKEKCLFEGYDGTIKQLEDLIELKITVENMVKYDLQLTPYAVNQISL